MPRKIEISYKTIVFAVGFVLSLWLIWQVKNILLTVFVSLILMAALNPLVDLFEKWRLSRGLAILIAYIILWLFIGLGLAGIIPPLIDQTRHLIIRLPVALSHVEFFNSNQQAITRELLSQIGALPENLLRFTFSIFGNVLALFTTLVITYYLLLERKNLIDKYLNAKISKTILDIEKRLGSWVRGELFLMFAVGTLTYVGLLFLGIDIALPLAILAGILEIVPNIGPVISAVPAVLIALTLSPVTALATASLYFLVQIVENNFLVPRIMQAAVGVNPLISILGLMTGFQLAGPAGAVLAIPLIIVIQTIGLEYYRA